MKFYSYLNGWKTLKYHSDFLNNINTYSIYCPKNKYSIKRVIVALHGSNGSIYEYVPTSLSHYAKEENLLLVCPNPAGYEFSKYEGEQIVLEILNKIKNNLSVDENKIYILGNSMGGRGASFIGLRNSQIFAGIVCIYGTITESDYDLLAKVSKKIPFFIAHGAEDQVIPLSESEALSRILKRLSFKYNFKIIDGLGHDLKVLNLSLPSIFRFFNSFD